MSGGSQLRAAPWLGALLATVLTAACTSSANAGSPRTSASTTRPSSNGATTSSAAPSISAATSSSAPPVQPIPGTPTATHRHFAIPPAARPVPTSLCLSALTAEDQYLKSQLFGLPTRDQQLAALPNVTQFTTSALAKVVNARKMFLSHGYGPSFVMVRDLSDLVAEHSAVLTLSEKQDLAGLPAVYRRLQLSLAQYAVDADAYPRVCSA